MASDPWKTYNKTRQYILDGTLDFNTALFYMALFQNGSNCTNSTLNPAVFGSLTNEVPTLNGYVTGGTLLTNPQVNVAGNITTFTIDDGTWLAVAGSFTFRYAVIYVNQTVNGVIRPLVCYTTPDNTPNDIIVNNGATLAIEINSLGVFTLSGM